METLRNHLISEKRAIIYFFLPCSACAQSGFVIHGTGGKSYHFAAMNFHSVRLFGTEFQRLVVFR